MNSGRKEKSKYEKAIFIIKEEDMHVVTENGVYTIVEGFSMGTNTKKTDMAFIVNESSGDVVDYLYGASLIKENVRAKKEVVSIIFDYEEQKNYHDSDKLISVNEMERLFQECVDAYLTEDGLKNPPEGMTKSFYIHWNGYCCDLSNGPHILDEVMPFLKEIEEEISG